MRHVPAPTEQRIITQLTIIKLALQLLERRGELPEDQRRLVLTALTATDHLSSRFLESALERRQQALFVQAEHLQDDNAHYDRADDRQDVIAAHSRHFPAADSPLAVSPATTTASRRKASSGEVWRQTGAVTTPKRITHLAPTP